MTKRRLDDEEESEISQSIFFLSIFRGERIGREMLVAQGRFCFVEAVVASLFLSFKRRHSGPHDLVDEKKIGSDHRTRVQKLNFHSVVVEDSHVLGQGRFPG